MTWVRLKSEVVNGFMEWVAQSTSHYSGSSMTALSGEGAGVVIKMDNVMDIDSKANIEKLEDKKDDQTDLQSNPSSQNTIADESQEYFEAGMNILPGLWRNS